MQCKSDQLIGTFITLEDAAEEIGKICDSYNAIDIDFTVLLTHIGFEEDKKLAAMLDPAWGVDVIIGGHSHTFLEEPAMVNGIPIVQAGTGTDQIGRFDIMVDTDENKIDSFTWKPIPINEKTCPRDPAIEGLILNYKNATDEKYGRILTKFVRKLTHPSRIMETELGDLYADILKDALGLDIFLLGSGSIRTEELGPVVTKGDFDENYPYNKPIHATYWTGKQLKHGLMRMLRDEALEGAHTEFYQLSKGLEVEYDQNTHEFLKFDYEGEPIDEDRVFTVGLEEFHFRNTLDGFDLSSEDLEKNHSSREIATASAKILEEYLQKGQHQNAKGKGRLIIHLKDGTTTGADGTSTGIV